MINILAIVCFFLVLYWDVQSDYKKWLNNIPVKHTKEAIIRALLLIPSLLCLVLPNITILKILISLALMGSTYLLLFDGWYNVKRGQNWWFLGTVDEDDSWWDKFQRKIKLKTLKILKIGIPIALLITFLFIK